jgi:hypothetical protein
MRARCMSKCYQVADWAATSPTTQPHFIGTAALHNLADFRSERHPWPTTPSTQSEKGEMQMSFCSMYRHFEVSFLPTVAWSLKDPVDHLTQSGTISNKVEDRTASMTIGRFDSGVNSTRVGKYLSEMVRWVAQDKTMRCPSCAMHCSLLRDEASE